MADSKNKRLFDLQETHGTFQLKGIVTGVEKDGFYRENKTKTGRAIRNVNFGVIYDKDHTLYVNLSGMVQDNVYFSKREDNKTVTEKVPWEDRFTYNREGYRLIGKNIGVKKIVDKTGATVNDKKVLTDFDACREVSENLKDDASVFIRGKIDYNSYVDNNGNKRLSVKLVPDQISLCSTVDFNAEDYNKQDDFNQQIVFTGIEQEKENDKPTGRFIVSAKIVTYNSIEDATFVVENKNLANKFKKSLKPYDLIKVHGHIVSVISIEEVNNEDDWGEPDPMKRTNAPYRVEYIITGADGTSIDSTLYSEESVMNAIAKIRNANKAENDFGDDNEWGSASDLDDDDDAAWD